jgi:uncharacterized metal-binding protein
MTVKATARVASEGEGIQYVCALGLPLGIESIVKRAQGADGYVALNGCEVGCAGKALRSVSIDPDQELYVTRDFCLEKNKNFNDESGLPDLIARVKKTVGEIRSA